MNLIEERRIEALQVKLASGEVCRVNRENGEIPAAVNASHTLSNKREIKLICLNFES